MSLKVKPTILCKQCDKPFPQRKTWQLFCSGKCRDAWHTERKNVILAAGKAFLAEKAKQA